MSRPRQSGPRAGSPGGFFLRLGAAGLRSRAWWIAAGYAVFATLWIYFSDHALGLMVSDQERQVRWSVYKGIGFVAVTAILLFLFIRRAFGTIEAGYALYKAKAEQLRGSEAHLDAVVRTAMDAIVVVDAAGRIVLFNAAAERMFRCSADEAVARPLEEFLPGDSTLSGAGWGVFRGRRRGGGEFPLEASVSLVEGGDRSRRTIILRDITGRQAHEEEIERLKRLYAALSHINQAIVRTPARDELFTKVCRALVEQGGFRLAWIGWHDPATRTLVPVAEWGDENGYLKNIRESADDGRPEGQGPAGTAYCGGRSYISNDLLADPATLPWRPEIERRGLRASAVFPIREKEKDVGVLNVYAGETGFFQDQEIALLAGAAADVSFALDNLLRESERRQAEATVRTERQFSDTMIESMPGVLYFYDTRGKFLRWNRNFETVSGYTGTEIAMMHPLDFFAGADRQRVEERIGEVFTRGESSVEAPFVAKDGRTTPYFFTGRRVTFDGRDCLVGVGIDLSERRQAEVALVRAEAADRIKSAFLATMSHELRTPLNSIIGFTGIVLQGLAGPLNAEQAKQLGMVRGSARHLLDLINDVLDISKIEAGQLEVRADPFELPGLIERAVASVRPMADKKGLAICRRLAVLLQGEITAASVWSRGSEFTLILPLELPGTP